MDRIAWLKNEIKNFEIVNNCSFNNDGLYNEMRILKKKYEQELIKLEQELKNES